MKISCDFIFKNYIWLLVQFFVVLNQTLDRITIILNYETHTNKLIKIISSDESILHSHVGPPKSAIESLILVVDQFFMNHFFIIFQFWIDFKHEIDWLISTWIDFKHARPKPARPRRLRDILVTLFRSLFLRSCGRYEVLLLIEPRATL